MRENPVSVPFGISLLACILFFLPGCGDLLECVLDNIWSIDTIDIEKFDAVPEQIRQGDESILTWAVKGADECSIEPDIGSVSDKGSVVVVPLQTTTYKILCRAWELDQPDDGCRENSETAKVTVTVY